MTRKFTVDGKNTIKLNGVNLTAGMLKKFTAFLVDVHGQSEHFELLSNVKQLELIDKFKFIYMHEASLSTSEIVTKI